jgi:hypothetical protein
MGLLYFYLYVWRSPTLLLPHNFRVFFFRHSLWGFKLRYLSNGNTNPVNDIKACGNGDVAPLVLVSVVELNCLLMLRPLSLGKESHGTLWIETWVGRSRTGWFGEVKNLLPIIESVSSSSSDHRVVTVPTELSRHIFSVGTSYFSTKYVLMYKIRSYRGMVYLKENVPVSCREECLKTLPNHYLIILRELVTIWNILCPLWGFTCPRRNTYSKVTQTALIPAFQIKFCLHFL